MKKKHLGSLIEQKVRESSMTITEFANRLNLERTSVYHIFKQESIDTERLKTISKILGYDFINEIFQKEEKETKTTQSKKTIFISFEIDEDLLKEINPQDYFIQLVKKRK